MKYRRIYQTLDQYGAKIAYDGSGWRYAGVTHTYSHQIRPLWVVAEAEKVRLRLWISHEAGRLSVTTANLTLPTDSWEYHQSQTHRDFRTQVELAEYLEMLLGEPSREAPDMRRGA